MQKPYLRIKNLIYESKTLFTNQKPYLRIKKSFPQSPIPNPQSPIPNPRQIKLNSFHYPTSPSDLNHSDRQLLHQVGLLLQF
jgi:hypothetical protein